MSRFIWPPEPAHLQEVMHIDAPDETRIRDYINVHRALFGHAPSNKATREALGLPADYDLHTVIMELIVSGQIGAIPDASELAEQPSRYTVQPSGEGDGEGAEDDPYTRAPGRTRVTHCRRNEHTVYVGRPSKWGNPFIIGKDGSRAEVIAKYRAWILDQPELLAQTPELRGQILGCWCHPLPCHGDVLADLADNPPTATR